MTMSLVPRPFRYMPLTLRRSMGMVLAAAMMAPAPYAAAEAQLSVSGGGSGHSTGSQSAGNSVSASINIRIVIPPVLRLLDNQHPAVLTAGPDGRSFAQQRLVFMSNLKQGACFTLRRPAGLSPEGQGAWVMRQGASNIPVSLQSVDGGYKLCATRPGHYTVDLEHEFSTAGAPLMASLPWPVQTDFTAI